MRPFTVFKMTVRMTWNINLVLVCVFFYLRDAQKSGDKPFFFSVIALTVAKDRSSYMNVLYFIFSKSLRAAKSYYLRVFKWKSILLLVVIFYSERDALDGWSNWFVRKTGTHFRFRSDNDDWERRFVVFIAGLKQVHCTMRDE